MPGDGVDLPRQEGIYRRGSRYYRVVKIYDECSERRQAAVADIVQKMRRHDIEALDLGDCYIAVVYHPDVALAVLKAYAH
jgi:hypothetical protein